MSRDPARPVHSPARPLLLLASLAALVMAVLSGLAGHGLRAGIGVSLAVIFGLQAAPADRRPASLRFVVLACILVAAALVALDTWRTWAR